jgi:hypothetical protein
MVLMPLLAKTLIAPFPIPPAIKIFTPIWASVLAAFDLQPQLAEEAAFSSAVMAFPSMV